MSRLTLTALLAAATLLGSCDEGRIYDNTVVSDAEGSTARVTATVSGVDTWPDGYNLVVAGFNTTDEYAVISKTIGTPDAEGNIDVVMSGISDEVTTLELCVINRLRRRIATFASVTFSASTDVVTFDAGDVDLSMFQAIQDNVFTTTCANCHGGSNYAAAGLHLTQGNSYGELVGAASTKVEGLYRVEPGQADQSVLYQVLSSELTTSWRYDHSREVLSTVTLNLIKDWIDNGAIK